MVTSLVIVVTVTVACGMLVYMGVMVELILIVVTGVTGVTASAYNGGTAVVLLVLVDVSNVLMAANMLRNRFTEVGGLLTTVGAVTAMEVVTLVTAVVASAEKLAVDITDD